MALGKPDAGKPPVRFDEGRSRTVIGPVPLNPSAPPTLQLISAFYFHDFYFDLYPLELIYGNQNETV